MSPREMDQQSIYLEPNKADKLDSLAKSTRIPKAVLLREAVDLLLAINGHKHVHPQFDFWVNNLELIEHEMNKLRHHKDTSDDLDKVAATSLAYLNSIFLDWNRSKRSSRDKNPPVGANSRQYKKRVKQAAQ